MSATYTSNLPANIDLHYSQNIAFTAGCYPSTVIKATNAYTEGVTNGRLGKLATSAMGASTVTERENRSYISVYNTKTLNTTAILSTSLLPIKPGWHMVNTTTSAVVATNTLLSNTHGAGALYISYNSGTRYFNNINGVTAGNVYLKGSQTYGWLYFANAGGYAYATAGGYYMFVGNLRTDIANFTFTNTGGIQTTPKEVTNYDGGASAVTSHTLSNNTGYLFFANSYYAYGNPTHYNIPEPQGVWYSDSFMYNGSTSRSVFMGICSNQRNSAQQFITRGGYDRVPIFTFYYK